MGGRWFQPLAPLHYVYLYVILYSAGSELTPFSTSDSPQWGSAAHLAVIYPRILQDGRPLLAPFLLPPRSVVWCARRICGGVEGHALARLPTKRELVDARWSGCNNAFDKRKPERQSRCRVRPTDTALLLRGGGRKGVNHSTARLRGGKELGWI